MTTFNWRNPRFTETGAIDVEIEHPQYGWIPFTATKDDTEIHGREIFEAAKSTAEPAIPRSSAQIRDAMPPLSSRQFWRAASSVGITKAAVLASVEASSIEDKEDILIEIAESSTVERLSPYIIEVAVLFGLDAQTLDSIWSWATTI